MRNKLSICKCNPCTCSDQTKDIYFQELKSILKRFNKEKLASDSYKNQFFKSINPQNFQ